MIKFYIFLIILFSPAFANGESLKIRLFAEINADSIRFKIENYGSRAIYFSDPNKFPVGIRYLSNDFPNSFHSIKDQVAVEPKWRNIVFLAPAGQQHEEEFPWEKSYIFTVVSPYKLEKEDITEVCLSFWISEETEKAGKSIIYSLNLHEFKAELDGFSKTSKLGGDNRPENSK